MSKTYSCIERPDIHNNTDLEEACLKTSKQYPSLYVTGDDCFGLAMISLDKYFCVDRIAGNRFGGYFLNGQFKQFTNKQLLKYQNAGITCE